MWDFYENVEKFKEDNGYKDEDNGNIWYPRVTKIVSIKAKPALYKFYGDAANFSAGQAISRRSATEGTLIHDTVEAILKGQDPEVDESVKPAISAFRDFLEKENIQIMPDYVEHRIFHRGERYAGTVDVLALIGGRFGVLDIKTSQAIYRDYSLQTAAYMEALKDRFQDLQTRWILRIDQIRKCLKCGATKREKGGREKIKVKWGDPIMKNCTHEWSEVIGDIELREFPYWQNDFEAFLGAKKLWEWENEAWLKKAGYL